jgi:peptide/nickel transport system substrate-binding protein
VLVGSATGMLALGANTTAPPTDNKLVRQALSFAVDRKRFAETTLSNLTGTATNLPWPAGSPAYDATRNQTYRAASATTR